MIISNTQITTKNLCDKAHDFRFVRNFEPKKLPPAIYRGVLGHSALEQYYLNHKDGKSVDECRDAALAVLDREISRVSRETPEEFETVGSIVKLRNLLRDYAEVYRVEPFKVIEVEKEYRTPVGPDIDYALKLDLLVEMISGERRGDLVVIDHKFVYNFKTLLEIEMDAQLPKYIYTLRQNGYVVTKGIFNQIRTRDINNPSPDQLYRRDWLKTTKSEIEQIWSEQKQVARQIYSEQPLSDNPVNSISLPPVRTLSLLVCRSCMFQGPCKAELNGDNVTQMLEANYQKSTYGYEDLSDA